MVFDTVLARPAASLAFAVGLLAACSTTQSLDNARLQQAITDGLQEQSGVSATVTCPDNQPIKPGNKFQCAGVTADGHNLQITVVQTDDAGNVTWQVTGVS